MKLVGRLLWLCVFVSTQVIGQWHQTSGPTGSGGLEIFEVNDSLFVNGGAGGVYRSPDKGLNWRPVNNGLPINSPCIATVVYDGKIYAAMSEGVYYSSDLGESWTSLTDNLHAPMGNGFYSIEVSGNEIYCGYQGGLYYSPDHGASWIFNTGINSMIQVLSMKVLENTLWIGTGNGLFSSADKGVTWVKQLENIYLYVTALHQSGDQLWVSGIDLNSKPTVSVSYNKGVDWTHPGLDFKFRNITGLNTHGNEVYIIANDAAVIFYSPDNGQSWTTKTFPSLYSGVNSAGTNAEIYRNDNDLFITCYDGVFYSNDNGISWTKRNSGYKNSSISDLDLDLENNKLICFAFNTSSNNGDSWNRSSIPSNFIVGGFLGQYVLNNIIIVASGRDVYKSTNGGILWQPILHLNDTQTDYDYNQVISGNQERLMIGTLKGVYLSADLGNTWKYKQRSEFGTDQNFVFSQIQQDTVVLASEFDVMVSTDFGETWKKKNPPRNQFWPTGFSINASSWIITTLQGIFISYDFGNSWIEISCPPSKIINDIKRVNQSIFISTDIGVFASPNDGINWYPVNQNLQSFVYTLVIGPVYAFAGTYGRGVWRIPTSDLLSYMNGNSEALERPVVVENCGVLSISNYEEGLISWYKDDVQIPNQNAIDLIEDGPGFYRAYLTTACGSIASLPHKALNIVAPSKPEISIECSKFIITNSPKDAEIQWYLDGEKISTDTIVIATSSGLYSVEFKNYCGVATGDQINFQTKEDVVIYNFVSPNGDGKNDAYLLTDVLLGSHLSVYNLWGKLMYDNPHYENSWHPNDVSGGVYFYEIKSNCYGKYKGTLTIRN